MPDPTDWIVERLNKRHDRERFSCGVADLDEYLRRFAGQNEKTGVTRHFVATPIDAADADASRVLGYYALSAGAVSFDHAPQELTRRLPRYPIPVAHLGRLAVDRSMQGRGLGEHLLIDAIARIVGASDQVAMHAIEVVAINDDARRFYLRYGFTPLADDERHLYLPLSAARKLGLP